MASEYPKALRNTVVRKKPRAHYDHQTIHAIINASPLLHVSFNTPDPEDPFTAVLPMLGFVGSFGDGNGEEGEGEEDLYLHGYVSSRFMRLGKDAAGNGSGEEVGLPVTVAGTLLDGIVLALTPNSHSCNYRSAILYGYAVPVTDVEEKLWAMEKITNGVITDRWAHTRLPPNKTEMTSTQILKVSIISGSAKIRSGPPHDDRVDMKNDEVRAKTWTGVIPTWTAYGVPVAGEENRVAKVPEHVTKFVEKSNKIGEGNANKAIMEDTLEY